MTRSAAPTASSRTAPPSEGIVRSHGHGLHFCLPEYTVDVDPPIVVLGSTRSEVRIDVTDDCGGRDQIEVA